MRMHFTSIKILPFSEHHLSNKSYFFHSQYIKVAAICCCCCNSSSNLMFLSNYWQCFGHFALQFSALNIGLFLFTKFLFFSLFLFFFCSCIVSLSSLFLDEIKIRFFALAFVVVFCFDSFTFVLFSGFEREKKRFFLVSIETNSDWLADQGGGEINFIRRIGSIRFEWRGIERVFLGLWLSDAELRYRYICVCVLGIGKKHE